MEQPSLLVATYHNVYLLDEAECTYKTKKKLMTGRPVVAEPICWSSRDLFVSISAQLRESRTPKYIRFREIGEPDCSFGSDNQGEAVIRSVVIA